MPQKLGSAGVLRAAPAMRLQAAGPVNVAEFDVRFEEGPLRTEQIVCCFQGRATSPAMGWPGMGSHVFSVLVKGKVRTRLPSAL